ncbi:O-antigen ligase family protein [Nocardia sp. NPDC127526]|uniref:O-antigen ligase family protein n=1 Tax=Nocardia sp. NPDC127526 TaxID=3345393 RepID=UPI00363751FB
MTSKAPAAPVLTLGWYPFALSVFAVLVAAEYVGPVIALAAAAAVAGSGVIWIRHLPWPRFPPAGGWLLAILILGLAGAIVANAFGTTPLDIDLQRDIGITLTYLLFLGIGYLFACDRASLRAILTVVAAAGLVISIVHLIRFGIVVSGGVSDLYVLRLEAGRGSHTQYAALGACLLLAADAGLRRWRRVVQTVGVIVTVSMLLTLSRGLMLNLVVLLAVMAALTVSPNRTLIPSLRQLVSAIVPAAAAVFATLLALRWFVPPAYQFLDQVFLAKVENSLTEVATTNLETRDQIADNYRAFESRRALAQVDRSPVFAQWLGQGWGSVVRFGVETASTRASFSRTEAAFLHNGYVYYLMKTGIAGLVAYLAFLGHLAFRAISGRYWPAGRLVATQRKVLLATVIVLAIDTPVTGGLGYPATYLGLVTLLGACCGPLWGRAPDSAREEQGWLSADAGRC